MKTKTAVKLLKGIKANRQYLYIDEWVAIKKCITSLINDNSYDAKKVWITNSKLPPLQRFWKWLWVAKSSLPYGGIIMIFIIGILVGWGL